MSRIRSTLLVAISVALAGGCTALPSTDVFGDPVYMPSFESRMPELWAWNGPVDGEAVPATAFTEMPHVAAASAQAEAEDVSVMASFVDPQPAPKPRFRRSSLRGTVRRTSD